ncbi:MAG: hypothetical protein AB8C95_00140 [Phycisphaeraceae bacterium]
MRHPQRHLLLMLGCLLTFACTGCISTGETIRVSGQIVNVDGEPVRDATVIAIATKRGGTLTSPSEIADPDAEDEAREATIDLPGDGTFSATSRWSGRLTISVEGYKIRRVDDLGTAFLVPTQSFFQSQNQVRLEVVKDE